MALMKTVTKESAGPQWCRPHQRDLFKPIMAGVILFFGYIGYYLQTYTPSLVPIVEKNTVAHQTHLIIEEKKPPPPPKVKKKLNEPEPVRSEPIDLTDKPQLAQKKDERIKSPETPQKRVRRVYGIKKVYSKGIGASGNASNAIIGKHGNTLNTAIDTINATDADLAGTPVSITTVTSYPQLKKRVKPEYTEEMLEHRVEGIVRVKVTVDKDGKVKKVLVLDDLGFGAKEKVAEACFKMLFEPAKVGEIAVATTILLRITFKMLDS